MARWQVWVLFLVVVGFGVAGCSPKAARLSKREQGLPAAAVVPQKPEGVQEKSAPGQAGLPAIQQQMIVYTVQLSLRVEDVRRTARDIEKITQELEGYVVQSRLSTHRTDGVKRTYIGEITVRVPSDRLGEALERFRSLALEVLSEERSSKDVTEEYVDLEARLRNLRATEQELLKFLERAKTINEVLKVYNQISRVREEIERLEGRKRYLERVSTYARITIMLQPKEVPPPVVPGRWSAKDVAQRALRALVETLQFLATVAIWLVLYGIPVLVLLAIPVYGSIRVAWLLYRRYLARRSSPPTASEE